MRVNATIAEILLAGIGSFVALPLLVGATGEEVAVVGANPFVPPRVVRLGVTIIVGVEVTKAELVSSSFIGASL